MSLEAGRDDFYSVSKVSRETLAQLDLYVALLQKWNPAINLVSRRSLHLAWSRHFLDSAQLVNFIPPSARVLADLGSGAGFPGLVLAILRPELTVHLIDSDQRKCVFLREVSRETGVAVTVHSGRIEDMPVLAPDVITARALAPVADLLTLSANIATEYTLYLFLKGRDIDVELTRAAKCWKIRHHKTPSIVDPSGTVLQIESAKRVSELSR